MRERDRDTASFLVAMALGFLVTFFTLSTIGAATMVAETTTPWRGLANIGCLLSNTAGLVACLNAVARYITGK